MASKHVQQKRTRRVTEITAGEGSIRRVVTALTRAAVIDIEWGGERESDCVIESRVVEERRRERGRSAGKDGGAAHKRVR